MSRERAMRRRLLRINDGHRLLPLTFDKDYIEIFRQSFDANGFKNHSQFTDDVLDIRYFDATARLIPDRPREIHLSSVFQPPAAGTKESDGLEALKRKIRRGASIALHQRRQVFDLAYEPDGMLLDWQIQHLHLGRKVDPQTRFIERTGPLLYARFEPDDAYFIDVRPHGAWAEPDLLETILANWPFLLTEMPGMQRDPALGPSVTPTERKVVRRKGFMTLFEASNGKVYMPGGGYSTARTANEAVRRADWLRDRVKVLERQMTQNFQGFCEQAKRQGVELPQSVRLRLGIDEKGLPFGAVEGTIIRFTVNAQGPVVYRRGDATRATG